MRKYKIKMVLGGGLLVFFLERDYLFTEIATKVKLIEFTALRFAPKVGPTKPGNIPMWMDWSTLDVTIKE